jgi:hypothetical protein
MVKSIDLPFSLKAPGGPFFTSPQFHLFRPIRAHLIWPVTLYSGLSQIYILYLVIQNLFGSGLSGLGDLGMENKEKIP